MFYENFKNLCQKVGKSPSFVVTEIGLNKSAVTSWKKGANPTNSNLVKISHYFGVSVDELLGKKDAVSESDTVSEDDIKAAFFEGAEDLTKEEMDALWADARDYMRYKLEQRRKQQLFRRRQKRQYFRYDCDNDEYRVRIAGQCRRKLSVVVVLR